MGSISLGRSLLVAALVSAAGAASCERGASDPAASTPYPAGPASPEWGEVVPDLAFDGVGGSGAPATIHLHDWFAPDGDGARVLVIAVHGGLWCGTCRWFGEHEGDLQSSFADGGVAWLDLVLGDRDNAPAAAADAVQWQETFASTGTAVGADPAFAFRDLLEPAGGVLPLFVVVDTKTMRIVDAVSNPDPVEWRFRIGSALAAARGEPPPARDDETLADGLFHENEWDLLRGISLPGAPPADPTNAGADAPALQALGAKLFFDGGLSPSGEVSCATCHDPAKALSDGRARAEIDAAGPRRTPGIALAAHARWQFWDGRADSAWAQALAPLENPIEFGSSRVFVARHLLEAYPSELAAAFPDAGHVDPSHWPAEGKPGDAAYDAMSDADKANATALFVLAGKAIEAYERTFRVEANALDAYVAGDAGALAPDEKLGLEVFVRNGCMQCHWGPRLTDDAFHDTRIPDGPGDELADEGRSAGLVAWQASEFRGDGVWSDDRTGRPAAERAIDPSALGQFKTPPLRGVADAAHWGHGGAFDELSGVTETYGRGGLPDGDPRTTGARDPWLPYFGETAEWALVPFLETLHAEPVMP